MFKFMSQIPLDILFVQYISFKDKVSTPLMKLNYHRSLFLQSIYEVRTLFSARMCIESIIDFTFTFL